MGVEIERRWLIETQNENPWVVESAGKLEISQYYIDVALLDVSKEGVFWGDVCLCKDDLTLTTWVTARFRLIGDECIFTMKSASIGASREEYEVSIDCPEGVLDLPGLVKTRFLWRGSDGMLWEIDVFKGELDGIVIAEVELPSEDHPVELPHWLGKELTNLKGWSNADLVKRISY